jgi:imidazolonepropionase-like amidohydrolase
MISRSIFLAAVLAALLQAQTRVALTGGMLLDGYEVPPIHHATVLIEGNHIVQAGRAEDVKIPAGTTIIDTSGQTMMPGMIELHAHLVIVGHGDYNRWFKWLDDHKDKWPIEKVMDLSAKQLLMAGITSAVDLGSPLKESISIRERVKRNETPGPRLTVSGPWIIPEYAIFPPQMQIKIKNAAEAAKATEANIAGGVDIIKAQGGLDYDELKAIADTAHAKNIKVHAHLYEEQATRDALKAGIDVLQHVGSGGYPAYSPDLVHAIADLGRPVVPTAAHRVWIYPDTVNFPERLDDPEIKAGFPADIWAEVADSFKGFHRLPYFQTTDRQMLYGEESVKQWIKAGAVIGMGTDNGTPMNFHSDALWREAKVFTDNGLSPIKTINALTRVNARIIGKSNQLGTIESGKLADIIVVKGNPLYDIVALRDVLVVMKDGILYKGGPNGK